MNSELHYTLIKSPAEFEQHRDIWSGLHTVHQQLRPALQDLTEYVERIRLMLREGAYYLWVKNPAEEIVAEAAQFAQDSPQPDESELWTDVLVEN